jgi:hypothetical protein
VPASGVGPRSSVGVQTFHNRKSQSLMNTTKLIICRAPCRIDLNDGVFAKTGLESLASGFRSFLPYHCRCQSRRSYAFSVTLRQMGMNRKQVGRKTGGEGAERRATAHSSKIVLPMPSKAAVRVASGFTTVFCQNPYRRPLGRSTPTRARLALRNITKRWTNPPLTWRMAANQFAIQFGQRFNK